MNGEERFLADLDPRACEPVALTVDVVALTIRDAELQVLLVRRGGQPFQGSWALPGGFVHPRTGPDGKKTEEGLAQTAARGLSEGAGPWLRPTHLEQLGSYGAPGRDPRMRVITVAYLAFAAELPEATLRADAANARWTPVSTLGLTWANGVATQRPGTTRPLAFDHARIVADGVERARAKLEYTPLATAFVRVPFTVSDLRGVYETVWGEKLHAGNFHRKVLSVPGFVESTGGFAETGGPRGGPRAKLYRPGDATLLHPPILRPSTEESARR